MTARWRPERTIEIVAGTPPGGGLDRSARALLKAIETNGLVNVPVKVVNVGGDGGRKDDARLSIALHHERDYMARAPSTPARRTG